jgi:flavin-binding protein dodecin
MRRSSIERLTEQAMTDHVYKHIELTGSSSEGIEQAIAGLLARAGESVRQMRWFEVADTRGFIADGKVAYWQVTVKVGFTIEE